MGRYDYPDPGTDPQYCDGLGHYRRQAESTSTSPGTEYCFYCRRRYADGSAYQPYCSKECSIQAELEGVA